MTRPGVARDPHRQAQVVEVACRVDRVVSATDLKGADVVLAVAAGCLQRAVDVNPKRRPRPRDRKVVPRAAGNGGRAYHYAAGGPVIELVVSPA